MASAVRARLRVAAAATPAVAVVLLAWALDRVAQDMTPDAVRKLAEETTPPGA